MTPEEQLIQRYFDAFNRSESTVMACFHEEPTLVHVDGKRLAGRQKVRHLYETEFAMSPRRPLRPANVHGQQGSRRGRVIGPRDPGKRWDGI